MRYHREQVMACLENWEQHIREAGLPKWDALPGLALYMDQVMVLLTQYLNTLPTIMQEDRKITASIINNYVRMKIMPPPVKKKYTKIHLAYLIMICTLKESLNIAVVQKIIPANLTEEEMAAVYDHFVDTYQKASYYFADQAKQVAGPVLQGTDPIDDAVDHMVVFSAVSACFCKTLVENMVTLRCDDAVPEASKNKSANQ